MNENPANPKNENNHSDIGYGNSFKSRTARLIDEDGSFNVKRTGVNYKSWFHDLIEMKWFTFFTYILLSYFLINVFFACLYYLLDPRNIAGIEMISATHAYIQCLFFSIQTFTTVGYGGMHPTGYSTQALAGFEALCGLLNFAVFTGLVYARFSKPKSKIIFSENGLISPYQNGLSIQIRLANMLNYKIIDMEASMVISFNQKTPGVSPRLFRTVPLELNKIVLFPLNWTLVHFMNDQSPLFSFTETDFKDTSVEILVFLKGYDSTHSQLVHAMKSYHFDDFIWNAKFKPMFEIGELRTTLFLEKINDYELLN
ncbi:MAG: ion channel [Bacteroidota bacterium]|nr:ion channel [Bacteroidota bacterium]